ncbi:MAG TPA: photosynthetic reaction center cytochrome c subunit family protein [Blastocatellia bacterium]|nr:photosynthetic reaction center cytochrome c subunit family protein [Blastocatellia bacterium]
MKKDDITYAVIGIVLGLVSGFIIANLMWTGTVPTSQAARGSEPQASVNSSSGGSELPANHPPVQPGQTVPAPPLPGQAPAGAAGPSEMPSLDPLPAGSRETRAEQQYKNIQLLRGVPAAQLTPIMNHFKSALGVDCTYCHIEGQEERDDKPMKKVAREMIQLTRDSNKRMGGGARVNCYTCHRGQARPPS